MPDSDPRATQPSAFASGRYEVRRFLGEGGKKRIFLAHDSLLDRDVAFALVRTEGLDATGRERVRREAQAMGRLGNHANLVSVLDRWRLAPAPPGRAFHDSGSGRRAPPWIDVGPPRR